MNPVVPETPVPVAIVGIGCMFPKAKDLSAFWSNIRDRVDAITEVPETHWQPDDYFDADPKSPDRTYARRGGFLTPVDFSPLEYGIAPNNLEATDTTQVLGLMVAKQALEDAGYVDGSEKAKTLDRSRVSVILGVTGTLELVIPLGARLGHPIWRRALKESGVDEQTAESVVERIAASYVPWQENSFPGLLGNVAAGRIANRLDLGGTNCVIDAACASSIGALNLAILELSTGRCDVALSGGLDTFNDIFMYMCFSKTPALSPTGNAKPFDATCDGTILGEGLGIVTLKRLDDAKRDGDTIYAVIKSVGSSSDGKGNAVYAPSASGQSRALRDTYRQAGVSPDTIELVEAHGTGTKVGDATELAALIEIYQQAKPRSTWCALGSVKSQIGHTKAAAGVAGLIKAALALHHKVLPPTIKVTQPLDGLGSGDSPFYVNVDARPWLPRTGHPRRAAVSAFGFGGSNFHSLLEEAEPTKTAIDWEVNTLLLAFSGPNIEAIKTTLDRFPKDLDPGELRDEAARTRRSFKTTDVQRLLLVVDRGADLDTLFKNAKAALDGTISGKARVKDGIFLGQGKPTGKLAFLFPGQGSQYVGMGRELACLFPAVQETLAMAETTVGQRFADLIYPLNGFLESDRQANEAKLRATENAQPAIAAISLGQLRLLGMFGVVADAFAGHSFGELSALRAAGWIDDDGFLTLARERGRLMAEQAQAGRGAMLAVMATIETVRDVLQSQKLDLVIANKNGPKQYVLSGPRSTIDQALNAFETRKITAKRLAVSAAFHSAEVAEASRPFLEAIRETAIVPNDRPVYSNTTATLYPSGVDQVQTLLAEQLAKPVEFAKEIEALSKEGVTTFLEVGPDSRLSGLVRSILEASERPGRALAVDASKGTRGNLADFAAALAELAAIGYPVQLDRWDEERGTRPRLARKSGMTVKVCGANPGPRPSPAVPAQTKASTQVPTRPAIAPPTAAVSKTAQSPSASKPSTQSISSPNANSRSIRTPATVASPLMTTNPPSRSPQSSPSAVTVSNNGSSHGQGGSSNGHSSFVAADKPSPPLGMISISQADPALLAQALKSAQDSLVALQQLGRQTADLHRQFLDGQEKTQRTFQSLLEQQQRLTLASVGLGPLPAPPAATLPTAVAPEVSAHRYSTAPTSAPASVARRFESAPTPVPIPTPPPKPIETVKAQPPKANATLSATVPAAASKSGRNATLNVLLDVVSEKTGYPVEMLEPSMTLDADLGIDSIKRVEILSALQEKLPDAPAIKPEHLGTLRTLADIVEFLGETSIVTTTETAAATSSTTPGSSTLKVLLEVVSEKTGYPAEMLEPSMTLDADLGIDSIKRVEILSALQEKLPDAPAIKPEHLGTLRTLSDIVEFLGEPALETIVATVLKPSTSDVFPSQPTVLHAIQETLLDVVSEKTGYPAEMLEPEMALDADLGIDSIKRVEILSALQERLPDAPAIQPEHLGTLRTLRDIVEFLADSPALSTIAAKPVAATKLVSKPDGGVRQPGVIRLVPEVFPIASTSVEPGRIVRENGEFWLVDDGSTLIPAVSDRLSALGYHVRRIEAHHVSRLSPPSTLDGLILFTPKSIRPSDAIKDAFAILRTASAPLKLAGTAAGALFATVSRLDGGFGFLSINGDFDPETGGGGLAGLAKTAAREWPEVHCKAIDLDPGLTDDDKAAALLVDELFRKGPVEVGLTENQRFAIELHQQPLKPNERKGHAISPGELVVVTGGARGVTAEVAVGLAEAYRPTLVLLGRSAAPEREPEWLAHLQGEQEIKRALATRANGHGSPQIIGEQFRQVAANREVLHTLSRIEQAGGTAVYRNVDVRDAEAVSRTFDELRKEYGPVRGLVHGAGVLADRRIEDQTDPQFATVLDTKVEGINAILDAVGPLEPRFIVLFSSTTARFGRIGQIAYAAANETLNKIAQREAKHRPNCRVVSINWGPWDGGMVTAALKPVFAAEGIAVIPVRDGAAYLVDELRSSSKNKPVEIVILGHGSRTEAFVPKIHSETNGETKPILTNGDRNGSAAPTLPLGLVFERPLDLDSIPILESHAIDGRGVVPFALILEWLAQGAIQRNPGLAFIGIDDLRLLKGAVAHDDRPETLGVFVGKAVRDRSGSGYVVSAELRGTYRDGRTVLHARGDVILDDRPAASTGKAIAVGSLRLPTYSRPVAEVYRDVLFHGPGLQGIERIEGLGENGFLASVKTGAGPSAWIDQPLRQGWLSDPLAIDCGFQLMVLWSFEQTGAPSLPTKVGRYRQFQRTFPAGLVKVVAKVERPAAHRETADMEFVDDQGRIVARIEGYECVSDILLNQSFRRNRVLKTARGPR